MIAAALRFVDKTDTAPPVFELLFRFPDHEVEQIPRLLICFRRDVGIDAGCRDVGVAGRIAHLRQ